MKYHWPLGSFFHSSDTGEEDEPARPLCHDHGAIHSARRDLGRSRKGRELKLKCRLTDQLKEQGWHSQEHLSQKGY
eukprot:5245743-Pyramimonas_sp.AAC.1